MGKDIKEEPDYSLKTEAVEALAGATRENTPKYSEEELNRYKAKKGLKLPSWLKALFIKYWFNGMVCFFFIWGLGMYIPSSLDLFAVTSIAMGFVTDLLVNNIFRFYEAKEGDNNKWIMFPKKSYISLVLNVVYAFVVMSLVKGLYNLVNTALTQGRADSVPFGVEPFTFGLIYLGFDMMFIGLKHLGAKILDDAKNKAKTGV